VRLFKNGFQALDPDEENAARLCGHGWLARTLFVELPRMGGVLVAAGVVAYVLCFTELAATLMVIPEGSQSVQIRVFNMIHYRAVGEVAALCVLVTLLAALPVIFLALIGRKRVDVL
jgi:iron(III) transport system permease protein